MTDTKHTPTALIADDGYMFDADHNIIGKTYDRRYAAHIVKCVNLHDELVVNFAELFKWLMEDSEEESEESIDRDSEMLERCREALKKAGAL